VSVFCSCWLRSCRSCSVSRCRISSRLAKSVVRCRHKQGHIQGLGECAGFYVMNLHKVLHVCLCNQA
jgi:hypothetical protein